MPAAQISYDRFHVAALANEAMDAVRREEMQSWPRVVRAALGTDSKADMVRSMHTDPSECNQHEMNTIYHLQRSNVRSVRACPLNQAFREVYAQGAIGNCEATAKATLQGWISWAKRCHLSRSKSLPTP